MRKLVPRIEAALGLPPESRIRLVQEERWIGYGAARRVISGMERLLQHPKVPRMPNMIVVGASGNGKTAVVRRFRNLHPSEDQASEEASSIPVVLVEAPPVPDEARLFQAILDEIHEPFGRNDSAGVLERRLCHVLPAVGARIIIIDEIQHALAGSDTKRRRFMNNIKHLGNVLMIPLVLVGVRAALNVISTDQQLASRFPAFALPLWTFNKDFRSLLASFEAFLPLHNPSNLADDCEIAQEIFRLSGGTIGNASSIVNEAAIRAIELGEERITKRLLLSLDLQITEDQLVSVAASTGRNTAL